MPICNEAVMWYRSVVITLGNATILHIKGTRILCFCLISFVFLCNVILQADLPLGNIKHIGHSFVDTSHLVYCLNDECGTRDVMEIIIFRSQIRMPLKSHLILTHW